MKPLLWKEYRELRAAVLIGAVAFVAVLALCHVPAFGDLRRALPRLSIYFDMMVALVLGAGQVVSERNARTLDHVLVRPVSARQVIAAKFIVGSGVLSVIVSLSLAILYLEGTPDLPWHRTLQPIGYAHLLLYVFTMYWSLYACALLFSTVVEQRAQAIACGLFSLMTVIKLSLFLQSAFPLGGMEVWFPAFFTSSEWPDLAQRTFIWVAAAGAWSLLAVLLACTAAWVFRKRWEPRIGWITIALLFLLLGPGSVNFYGVAVAALGEYRLDMEVIGGLTASGDRVCVRTFEGFVVIDFSDPAHPRNAGLIRTSPWTIGHVTIEDDGIYLTGLRKDLPTDRAGILYSRSIAPGIWDTRQVIDLGPADDRSWLGAVQVAGRRIYIGTASGRQSKLRVFDLPAEGTARQRAEVLIERGSRGPTVDAYSGPDFSMAIRDNHAYVATSGALLTLDVGDRSAPRIVNRAEFKDETEAPIGEGRQIFSIGDRLYVQCFRPPTLLRYDLRDPARPVFEGWSICRPVLGGGVVADEAADRLMTAWNDGILVFSPPDGLLIRHAQYFRGKAGTFVSGYASAVAVTSGRFYALLNDPRRIVAYPVPR